MGKESWVGKSKCWLHHPKCWHQWKSRCLNKRLTVQGPHARPKNLVHLVTRSLLSTLLFYVCLKNKSASQNVRNRAMQDRKPWYYTKSTLHSIVLCGSVSYFYLKNKSGSQYARNRAYFYSIIFFVGTDIVANLKQQSIW